MDDEIIGIVPNMRKSKMLGLSYDAFTLVATPDTTIFAKVTNDVMKQVVKESRDQAKAEGKGFLGQWGAQIKGSFRYAERYAGMSAQAALAENEANFAIPNASIKSIKVKKKSSSDDDQVQIIWEVNIQSNSGKLKFKTDFDPKDHFKKIYGDRVK
ncbi:MAG: hypothetical protein PWQ51_871 [Methanolobus sp.]|uniref:Uncharacterized protein n=1 Tax=Methanolobus tindarius DSM 2278 TaxID=1090322 RepID=W9DVT0_METTI|nr:hypothetical protein [Methanolobus tindarius]ETA67521.1 hypothetical protein MettiDRAFT_0947 [Methanolobus tindarius DSM 2278]MDI3487213.1 hypothetical protein [Methanolobus sp.]MDK2938707.1 hypothetical protein [Methanolobus sp.]